MNCHFILCNTQELVKCPSTERWPLHHVFRCRPAAHFDSSRERDLFVLEANVKSQDPITLCKIANKVICLLCSVKVGGVGTQGQTQQITLILQNKAESKSETNVGISTQVLIRGWHFRKTPFDMHVCVHRVIFSFVLLLTRFQSARRWITSMQQGVQSEAILVPYKSVCMSVCARCCSLHWSVSKTSLYLN